VAQLKTAASPLSRSAGRGEIKREVLQRVEPHICPVQNQYPNRDLKRKEPLRVVGLRKRTPSYHQSCPMVLQSKLQVI
jgi:hypothetical protein